MFATGWVSNNPNKNVLYKYITVNRRKVITVLKLHFVLAVKVTSKSVWHSVLTKLYAGLWTDHNTISQVQFYTSEISYIYIYNMNNIEKSNNIEENWVLRDLHFHNSSPSKWLKSNLYNVLFLKLLFVFIRNWGKHKVWSRKNVYLFHHWP